MNVALVGCGFLGSLWAVEALKRLYAIERQIAWLFVDRDKWELRNTANQLCDLSWNGKSKAFTLALMAKAGYGQTQALPQTQGWWDLEIDDNTIQSLTVDLFVDALDNLPARYAVWKRALALGVPVMHLGINASGSGSVEWSAPGFQKWHLGPPLAGRFLEPGAPQPTEPPCHLVQMRGLGLNLAVAAAKAFTLWMGEDVEELFGEGPQLDHGVLTCWDATADGHTLRRKEIHVREIPKGQD
jgi:hypothetical protein